MQHNDMREIIKAKEEDFLRYAQYGCAADLENLFQNEIRQEVKKALFDLVNYALYSAVFQINLDTIYYLVDVLGADVNFIRDGNTVLHHAVIGQVATPNNIIRNKRHGTREARNELVELLITRGAKTDVANKEKKAFFKFVEDHYKEICYKVINYGMQPPKIPAGLEKRDPSEYQYQLRYIQAKEIISTLLKNTEFDESHFTKIMLRFGTYQSEQWINQVLSLRDIIRNEDKYLRLELGAKAQNSSEEKRESKTDSTSDALIQLSKLTIHTQNPQQTALEVTDKSAATSQITQPSPVVDTPKPKLTGTNTLFPKTVEEEPTKTDTSTSQQRDSGKKYPRYNPSSVSSFSKN